MWYLVVLNIMSADSVAIGSFNNIQECDLHKERIEQIADKPIRVMCSHVQGSQRT